MIQAVVPVVCMFAISTPMIAQNDSQFFLFDARGADGRTRCYVSPLSHEFVFNAGLRPEAIVGELVQAGDSTKMIENPLFRELLYKVIDANLSSLHPPDQKLPGDAVLLDGRSSRGKGPVAPEDVIGMVEVSEQGDTVFIPSGTHRFHTSLGLMKLDPILYQAVVNHLMQVYGGDRED